MPPFLTEEFVIGAAAGAVLVLALAAAQIFRVLALTAAAVAIPYVYATAGVPGLLAIAAALQADLLARPDFAKGSPAAELGSHFESAEVLDIPNRDHMQAVGDKVYKQGVLAFLRRRP
jgi:hypothetical protein